MAKLDKRSYVEGIRVAAQIALLELKRDADAVAREGFGNEWSL